MALELATIEDGEEILKLYRSMLGTSYCRWNEHYPAPENVEDDFARDSLFCIKERGEVIAAISIDHDEDADRLECWSRMMQPAMELSRVCVRSDHQGQGIAGQMIREMLEIGKERGYRSAHFLVSKYNLPALKAYSQLGFCRVGECRMYGDDFWCYEKALS